MELPPTSFSWIADERVCLAFERAEAAGRSVELDSGFILVKWPAGVDRDAAEAAIRQLGQSMTEVTRHMLARARGKRGSDFVGQQCFIPELHAFGMVASSTIDGAVTVAYRHEDLNSELVCHVTGDRLLILVSGEEEPARDSSASQNAEAPWRRLVRRTFGG